mmetsp:Transcript_20358/g.58875  ORF Transcript_20358/g.58875 Transcript_20358/m.58875 type:complete len:251 (-) Transcript_20358:126-878(-)
MSPSSSRETPAVPSCVWTWSSFRTGRASPPTRGTDSSSRLHCTPSSWWGCCSGRPTTRIRRRGAAPPSPGQPPPSSRPSSPSSSGSSPESSSRTPARRPAPTTAAPAGHSDCTYPRPSAGIGRPSSSDADEAEEGAGPRPSAPPAGPGRDLRPSPVWSCSRGSPGGGRRPSSVPEDPRRPRTAKRTAAPPLPRRLRRYFETATERRRRSCLRRLESHRGRGGACWRVSLRGKGLSFARYRGVAASVAYVI